MKKFQHISLCLLMLACFPSKAQIVINEIMQSNIDCIMDDRHEFPDSWVELYNASDTSINTTGYSLSIERRGEQYNLQVRDMPAHTYRLIYCDKENTGWHTSFRLESGKGCNVFLWHNGLVVDSIVGLAKQPAPNISYGRTTDGANTWGYQQTPTPRTANCGATATQCLPEPIFSLPGQVITQSGRQQLSLSIPQGAPEGTIIRYTIDGTEPTLTNGITYTSTLYFNASITLRAKLFCEGYLSPRATTHSYIYHKRAMSMPIISISTDPTYLTDPENGIYVAGNWTDGVENYKHDWRRPINIELFEEPNSLSAINQLCETRIQGGASRGYALKSMVIYANKRFGTKRLQYEFFPDQRPGTTNYKSILLRNAGNDFDYLYMRDAIIQRSMAEHADLDWQAWRPAIVYINGTYKGILNIRDRSNDDNIFTYYDELEDITMVENGYEVKAGTWAEWQEFIDFYSQHGHTWQEYEQVMDCREYINLMIMNLFYNNQDFPGNNIVYWKPRHSITLSSGKTILPRWRWIAKDTDFGLGLYDSSASYHTFDWLYDNNYDPNHNWANTADHTRLFRRAMENADFQREFIDRSLIYIGDFLNYDSVWPMWENMYEQIRSEYKTHRDQFNPWWPNYQDELNKAKRWLQQRPAQYISQMRTRWALGEQTQLTINTDMPQSLRQELNLVFSGVDIPSGQWNGTFLTARPITLTTSLSAESGWCVTGWEVEFRTGSESYTNQYQGETCTFSIPNGCTEAIVRLSVAEATGIERPESSEPSAIKRLENGQVIILRDGQRYTTLGLPSVW